MTREQRARANIDNLLEQAGWSVQNADSINLYASGGVAVREFSLKAGHGAADYLLYVNQMEELTQGLFLPVKRRGGMNGLTSVIG